MGKMTGGARNKMGAESLDLENVKYGNIFVQWIKSLEFN